MVYPGLESWTGVLGHSQPSLRDCSWLSLPNPGLASWATLSRPFGTQFVIGVLTQTLWMALWLVLKRFTPEMVRTNVD